MKASGAPVSGSLRMKVRIERGRPFSRLAMFEPYHFIPALRKRPPR
jgi:hypothetical protein